MNGPGVLRNSEDEVVVCGEMVVCVGRGLLIGWGVGGWFEVFVLGWYGCLRSLRWRRFCGWVRLVLQF
jgi:hypothetical protein